MEQQPTKPALARAVVQGTKVQLSDQVAVVGKPSPETHAHDFQVEFIKDGSIVRGVSITCKCGEVIRLRFDYE